MVDILIITARIPTIPFITILSTPVTADSTAVTTTADSITGFILPSITEDTTHHSIIITGTVVITVLHTGGESAPAHIHPGGQQVAAG